MIVHQAPSEVMLCSVHSEAITRMFGHLMMASASRYVGTVEHLRWICHKRTLLHEACLVTTVAGLGVSMYLVQGT